MADSIPLLTLDRFPEWGRCLRRPFQTAYRAMYSSVFGGIVTEPELMLVPVDDHMVHRGDGVFEAFKCVAGAIYNLGAHLDRLEHSAAELHFRWPCTRAELGDRIAATIRAGAERDCLVRVLLSRGSGSFGVNPYDCPSAQLYIVVTHLKPPFMKVHPEGARLKTSVVPAKPVGQASIKNCNYLPNVLMAKEAVDAGVDFVVSLDEGGNVAEGATENVGMITAGHELAFPALGGILKGTTMIRTAELAGALVAEGFLSGVSFRPIPQAELRDAAAVLVVGTTPNLVHVREYDGRVVGDGKPGERFERLRRLLEDDILHNAGLRTPVFPA
ncbi:MAG: hypothetical protein A2269_05860 [Lentisphaerae bacterium RIFOXYA12_FULL_60_10]|nr:MAG: hypothetical protein A2269_05860 [Lentisphaerae bacterium RIFOXYA12_FULL_60_10]